MEAQQRPPSLGSLKRGGVGRFTEGTGGRWGGGLGMESGWPSDLEKSTRKVKLWRQCT